MKKTLDTEKMLQNVIDRIKAVGNMSEVARRSGRRYQVIERICRGVNKNLKLNTLQDISDALDEINGE